MIILESFLLTLRYVHIIDAHLLLWGDDLLTNTQNFQDSTNFFE